MLKQSQSATAFSAARMHRNQWFANGKEARLCYLQQDTSAAVLEDDPYAPSATEEGLYGNAREDLSDIERKQQEVIEYVVDYNRITYYQLGVVSEEERNALMGPFMREVQAPRLAELRPEQMKATANKIREWHKNIKSGLFEKLKTSAKSLYQKTEDAVTKAAQKGYISIASEQKWMRELRNPAVGFKQKENFVKTELKNRLDNAKKIAEKRDKLLKEDLVQQLEPDMVSNYHSFFDQTRFLDLHYHQRVRLVQEVAAARTALKNRHGNMLREANKVLVGAVRTGAMHSNRIGPWMASLFKKNRPTSEIHEIITSTLPGYIATWQQVRFSYDIVEKNLDDSGTPEGFQRKSADEFLALDMPARKAYISNAYSAIHKADRERYGRFWEVRRDVDAGDFEAADEKLNWLKGQDLTSQEWTRWQDLKDRVKEGLAKQKKIEANSKFDPHAEAFQLYKRIQGISPQVADTVAAVALKGSEAINMFKNGIFNVIWCMNNHVTIYEDHETMYQMAEQGAKERSEAGGQYNSRRHTLHKIGTEDRIKEYDDHEWSANIDFVDNNEASRNRVAEYCYEKKDNRTANYWTSFMFRGLDRSKYFQLLPLLYSLRSVMRSNRNQAFHINSYVPGPKPSLN